MKNILIVLILLIGFTSCENEQDVKSDLQKLKIERTDARATLNGNREMLRQVKMELQLVNEQITTSRIERDMVREGKEPMYILKLKLKQSHFSIDPMKHIKDGMNAIEFELPVSKEFYDSVKIGTNIVDDFRVGSAVFSGSYGSWKMSVTEKRIK